MEPHYKIDCNNHECQKVKKIEYMDYLVYSGTMEYKFGNANVEYSHNKEPNLSVPTTIPITIPITITITNITDNNIIATTITITTANDDNDNNISNEEDEDEGEE
ncbi:unnamed protein product [Cunninghamella blakesleeana]